MLKTIQIKRKTKKINQHSNNMEFLESDTINNPSSVEEIFCKEMDKAKKKELDNEYLELFVQLHSAGVVPTEKIKKEDKFFLYDLIEKRVQYSFSYEINDARVILLLASTAKTAGIAVMYLTYIQYLCKKHGVKELTFETLCQNFFKHGFIDDTFLRVIWDKQKVKKNQFMSSDNLLDYQSAMKSIQFEKETVI